MPRTCQVVIVVDAENLEGRLMALNEAGIHPVIPFVDADGFPSVAYGTAPGGDGWAVDLAAPRDPDTGARHCCACAEHAASDCDAGTTWTPRYPLTALLPDPAKL